MTSGAADDRRRALPRHADPTTDDRRSVAPYNFVPLPEAVMSAPLLADGTGPWQHHDEYLPGTHSGWIDLKITAETPLYIRCAPPAEHAADENTRTNRHRQDFFHLGDPNVPIIPGSSLRGMTRALVEILSYSSIVLADDDHRDGWFTDQKLVYRAVGDTASLGIAYRRQMLGENHATAPDLDLDYPSPNLCGGYLRRHDSDWYIQPARRFDGESLVHVDYDIAEPLIGDRGRQRVHSVWVKHAPRTAPNRGRRGPGLTLRLAVANELRLRQAGDLPPDVDRRWQPGWLVESGHMGRPRGQQPNIHQKHMHCVMFEANNTAASIGIPHELRRLYEDDREISRGLRTRPLRPQRRDDQPVPVFYLMAGDRLVFFGPTMMFRVPYNHAIGEFIPEHLRNSESVDVAQAIFGTVDRKQAIKGRVFFSDAVWDRAGDGPFLGEGDAGLRTPQILGTPKPTSFQHYLVQPIVDATVQDDRRRAQQLAAPAAADRRRLNHYHHPVDGGPYELRDNNDNLVATTPGTVIRGHKRYWHKRGEVDRFKSSLVREEDRRDEFRAWKQLTIVRPVRPQTIFAGRVRFENLTDVELGALLAALELPPSKRHHLGMGKALGMGSVRIEPMLQLIDRATRYAGLCDDSGMVSTGEVATDHAEAIKARCRQAFNTAIVGHHNRHAPAPEQISGDLWRIPRLAELAALLEWDSPPPISETGFAPHDAPRRPNGDIELRWWRERRVLPTPRDVARPPIAAAVADTPTISDSPRHSTAPRMSSLPARTASASGPAKRACNTPARVQILAVRPKGGYKVQEAGKSPGTLTLGSPPPELKVNLNESYDVLVHVDDPRSPQYKWPAPTPARGAAPPKKGN